LFDAVTLEAIGQDFSHILASATRRGQRRQGETEPLTLRWQARTPEKPQTSHRETC